MRESEVESYLRERVERSGGYCRKVKWGSEAGAPDRRVCLNGVCFWVEVKSPEGRLRRKQQWEHHLMSKHGERIFVIDNRYDVDRLLNEVMSGADITTLSIGRY